MAVRYTSDLYANGTHVDVPLYANGTAIYRLIGNGVDYFHKFTEVTENASVTFSLKRDNANYSSTTLVYRTSTGNVQLRPGNYVTRFTITSTGATVIDVGSSYMELAVSFNFPEGALAAGPTNQSITGTDFTFNFPTTRSTSAPYSNFSNRFAYTLCTVHLVNFKIQFPSGIVKTINENFDYIQGNSVSVNVPNGSSAWCNVNYTRDETRNYSNTYETQEY